MAVFDELQQMCVRVVRACVCALSTHSLRAEDSGKDKEVTSMNTGKGSVQIKKKLQRIEEEYTVIEPGGGTQELRRRRCMEGTLCRVVQVGLDLNIQNFKIKTFLDDERQRAALVEEVTWAETNRTSSDCQLNVKC